MIKSLTIATAAVLAIGIAPAIQAGESHHDYDHDSNSHSSYHHESHDSDSHHSNYHRPVKKKIVVKTHRYTRPTYSHSGYSYPYGYGYSNYGYGYGYGGYNSNYYSNYYSGGYYR
jgi:hypothetical protein